MNGHDKSLVLLAGKPLVAHVIERLSVQTAAIAINANGNASRFAAFALPVVADTVEDLPGPLAGILAGLEWAAGIGASHVFSIPTDTPFFPKDVIARLAELPGASRQPALAISGGRRHPAIGLWPVSLAGQLRDFLAARTTFKVSVFADRCDAASVEFPMVAAGGRQIDPFFNVNTPDDLAAAEVMLKDMR